MGWASGSDLGESVWKLVRRHVPKEKRRAVARKMVDLFSEHEADDWHDNNALWKAAEIPDDDDDTVVE